MDPFTIVQYRLWEGLRTAWEEVGREEKPPALGALMV